MLVQVLLVLMLLMLLVLLLVTLVVLELVSVLALLVLVLVSILVVCRALTACVEASPKEAVRQRGRSRIPAPMTPKITSRDAPHHVQGCRACHSLDLHYPAALQRLDILLQRSGCFPGIPVYSIPPYTRSVDRILVL